MELSQRGREGVIFSLVALGAVAVVYMWWGDTAPAAVAAGGPWLTSVGRVTGLVGTYLVVVEVLLMSRVPWLDRMIGMDRLAVWHRRNGEYSICLLVAHAAFIIWGYAVTAHEGLVSETGSVVLDYPDMLAATVGLGLLVVVGVLSARAVRRRVSYHTWYFIHLYTYIALALSFAHQFNTGLDFAGYPLHRVAWAAMYIFVGIMALTFRVVTPLARSARQRFVVTEAVSEGPGVVSIYVSGRDLPKLKAQAGQFFMWRFLNREGWWQAHPFSLSAAPNQSWLRLTAKSLGDYSSNLAGARPGLKAILEGPYGAFTLKKRKRRKVLLVGAGIGVTPLRAMLEPLCQRARPGDVVFLYRATHEGAMPLRAEIDHMAAHGKVTVHYLLGSRTEHPGYLTPGHILSLVPDVAERDIFVCGPAGMAEGVRRAARDLGVPAGNIHSESFEF